MAPHVSRNAASRRSFCWSLSLLMFLLVRIEPVASQSHSYNENTVLCSTGQSQEEPGYNNLLDLQNDIYAERARLDDGEKEPESSYQFVLCADTDFKLSSGFDGFGPLRPMLDNIQISCGLPPRKSNKCIITGNDVQVFVEDFQNTAHPVTELTFIGVTFSRFTNAAITGTASSAMRVLVVNSQFSDFTSAYIASQQQQIVNGGTYQNPFRLEVFTAHILNANVHVGFFLIGGSASSDQQLLLLQDLEVFNSEITGSLMSVTGSVNATLENSIVTFSDARQIAAAQLGAQVTIQNTQVSSMKTIEHVLQASGDGTTALLKELTIKDNTNEDQFSWQYVEVTDGATVLVSDSQFTGNHNVMFGFHASAGGIINIRDVVATENRGALLVSPQEDDSVSSVVFANDGGTVSIYDSEFGNTDMITSAFFAFQGSSIHSRRTCLSDMETEGALLFCEFDSDMAIRENNAVIYSSVSDNPLFCPQGAARMAFETTAESECFRDGKTTNTENCIMDCEAWATLNDCAVIPDKSTTDPPTMAPTVSPTVSASPTVVGNTSSSTLASLWFSWTVFTLSVIVSIVAQIL